MVTNLAATMLNLPYNVVLGSHSPRRKELLKEVIPFTVKTLPGIDESYPSSLPEEEIPIYVARKKAAAYLPSLEENELLITADTIVRINRAILGKPADRDDALRMLRLLSGKTHQVLTGVCLTTHAKALAFSVASSVRFAPIQEEDLQYYVDHYHPYDKAGAYGIQEWIGYIAVEEIAGSFYNVMGLPVQRLYQELSKF
jgi:septum formation protein